MTGIELIQVERQRQMEVEGWTPEHDDAHDLGEMVIAAWCYAEHSINQARGYPNRPRQSWWPWSARWWKPSPDPIRNLVKAGALIAAEIDRLQRTNAANDIPTPVEPKAQVESDSVEHCPVCDSPIRGIRSQVDNGIDKFLVTCDHHWHEPKEVESGGLPPLKPTPEDFKNASDCVTMDGSGPAWPCYPEFQCRERQLKASLLREKGLRELLLSVRVMFGFRSDLIREERELLLSVDDYLKAAVTGE